MTAADDGPVLILPPCTGLPLAFTPALADTPATVIMRLREH
jgi:hypothetical protein